MTKTFAVLALLLVAPIAYAQEQGKVEASRDSELEKLAQQRIDALNAHDADAMHASTSPDAEQIVLGSDEPPLRGRDAIVADLKERFKRAPKVQYSVQDRRVYGDLVVQHFRVTGISDDPETKEVEPSELKQASVILVRDGKVQRIWVVPSASGRWGQGR
jgi:uncharacterized protein (TIGR02246 family)